MNKSFKILEFDKIIETLKDHALTDHAKKRLGSLEPFLSERDLTTNLRETGEARLILDKMGTPPLVSLEGVEDILLTAKQGGCLFPEQLEYMESTLTAVMRLKDFLNRCKHLEIGLPFYEVQLNSLDEVKREINEKIRGARVDDYASKLLEHLRREISSVKEKMQRKAESLLKSQKECFSDSFITTRNGHICLPVKKEYKFKINGSVIEKSSTGATLFMEPSGIAQMNQELQNLILDEENEERRILYTLTALVYDESETIRENINIMEKLDFIFAKGKLSLEMNGVAPKISTERKIRIKKGRHPFLNQEECVPLDFEAGDGINGIVITGPNTGGKTVAIKTVGLLSAMAQSGLHVPCEEGQFTMNSQILCDIGDGQNITENLSTFSAHITNVLEILRRANRDSLIIMDELGSGTDPAEGMGIAIAILEELRTCGCLFLATTHYPEVKSYAEKADGIRNARMAFDRESLRPLYRLEIGAAGESCAFYIAKQLGMPAKMLRAASKAAYGSENGEFDEGEGEGFRKESAPKIQKKERVHTNQLTEQYQIGDSVMVSPEQKIGIVCRKVNEKGVLQVQFKDKKIWISHKRVKLLVRSEELYPEDYDFSIIFDSIAVRKARHQMGRKYTGEMQVEINE